MQERKKASPRRPSPEIGGTPPPVEVRPARHGLGLFAQRLIVPHEIIGEVTGKIVHQTGYGSEYCIDLDPGRALEPDAPFRYANHSCDPNCELCSWEETEGDITPDRVWFTALRAIQPGEELTIDYAWDADAAIPCGCGSANCRGWIVEESELEDVLARERGAALPRLNRRRSSRATAG